MTLAGGRLLLTVSFQITKNVFDQNTDYITQNYLRHHSGLFSSINTPCNLISILQFLIAISWVILLYVEYNPESVSIMISFGLSYECNTSQHIVMSIYKRYICTET